MSIDKLFEEEGFFYDSKRSDSFDDIYVRKEATIYSNDECTINLYNLFIIRLNRKLKTMSTIFIPACMGDVHDKLQESGEKVTWRLGYEMDSVSAFPFLTEKLIDMCKQKLKEL